MSNTSPVPKHFIIHCRNRAKLLRPVYAAEGEIVMRDGAIGFILVFRPFNLDAATRHRFTAIDGRILTLLRFERNPKFFPVMIMSGFLQGAEMAQSAGSPKLSGPLETALALSAS